MPHQTLEHGYFTAKLGVDDVWVIANGTCMPRNVNTLSDDIRARVPEDRLWRQEKYVTGCPQKY